ncbi:MAG: response regulator, partial [Armatimonadetes bacterium]|nr:response regulator [Armatimonadota bacterium]
MAGPYAPTSVLIVDDNQAAAKTLAIVLRSEGHDAEFAAEPDEALAMARSRAYDAALIDIGLPGRSGLDVLADLKAEHPELIGIIVTGQASTESSIEALNRGASGYLQKPVDVQHLLGLLRSGLERQRLEAENRRMLRRLSLLYAVGAQASGGLDAATTLQETISLVASLLDLPGGGIWWSGGEGAEPVLAASIGLCPSLVGEVARRLVQFEERHPSDLARRFPWLDVEIETEAGPPWRLRVIPLQGHQSAVGFMAVGGPGWTGDQLEEAEVVSAVAWQVGVAMENMRL